MAKRARGTSRPGQRRPTQKSAARPVGSSSAIPAAGAVTTGDAAAAVSAPTPAPAPARSRRDASGAFSATAVQEYAYVRSDLRRIAKVAAGLFGTMLVLFVLIDVTGIIKL
jgi:hypothetical protein